jgi:hypothetical protein
MSAILSRSVTDAIHEEIRSNLAWHGNVSGLSAEKKLRGRKTPYLYLLRAGELDLGDQKDYYVSYILKDGTIKHQPFTITEAPEGWYYENAGGGGPYLNASILDVLHLIMHCEKGEIVPLPAFGD